MRTLIVITIVFLSIQYTSAQNLKPYILGLESTKSLADLKDVLKTNLESNSIKVVGNYSPAGDNNRWVMIVSSEDLEEAIQKVGGLSGFAATLRVAITVEAGKTIVSYTNPVYWGNAYFRDVYPQVSVFYNVLVEKLISAMEASGEYMGTSFGSEKGISALDLREYHYMMGMPYFDDTVELEDFDSYNEAVSKIDASIAAGVPHVKQVYKLSIPDKNLTLYGFALSGEEGEREFLPIIDIGNPKHTAFLPYEVLVMDNEVHMLHGRYRIALSFPDLTMGTFTKIMSTPGDIEDLLEQLVKD